MNYVVDTGALSFYYTCDERIRATDEALLEVKEIRTRHFEI